MSTSSAFGRKAQRPPAQNSGGFFGLFGKIRSVMGYASNDAEYEENKDESGKRQRADGDQNETRETFVDERPSPAKKARITTSESSRSRMGGYNDPPKSAFPKSLKTGLSMDMARLNTAARRRASPLGNRSNNTGPSRTRAYDPPQSAAVPGRIHSDVQMRSLSSFPIREGSMEAPAPMSVPRSASLRESSLPRVGSSFRMRTSTPQPIREASEPPTITSLTHKPVFVRAPNDIKTQLSMPTLGSLVDRRTQSPVRHSSSALFGYSQARPQEIAKPVNSAGREIVLLDAYRTPLQPSRIRAGKSLTGPSTTHETLGRKKSFQRTPGARGGEALAAKKQTNPYDRGNAAVKKTMSRNRKAEAEEQASKKKIEDEERMVDDMPTPKPQPKAPSPEPLKELRLPKGVDDFKPLERGAAFPAQSSLRIGRANITRQHGPPTRSGRAGGKFSASFDIDDDPSEDKERALIDEASKKLPAFSVPPGFSFAKDAPAPSLIPDATAKEPPIAALPFSLGAMSKPAPVPPIVIPSATPTPAPVSQVPAPAKPGGVPDFFSKSKPTTEAPAPASMFSFDKPAADAPKPSGSLFSFAPQPSAPAPAPTQAASTPAPEADNPFADKPKEAAPDQIKSLFGGPPATAPKTTTSLFGAPSSSSSLFGSNATGNGTASLFSKPAEKKEDEPKPAEAAKPVFSFGAPPSTAGPSTAPSMLFGKPAEAPTSAPSSTLTSLFGAKPDTPAPSAPATNLFGAKPAEPAPAPTPTVSKPSFSFGAPAAPAASAPGPTTSLFGGASSSSATTGGFSFGAPPSTAPKEDAPKPPTFSFGATAPAAPKDEPPKPAPTFSFGASAPSAAPDAGHKPSFSFGAPTQTKSEPAKASFSFGTPAATPTTSTPFAFGGTSTPTAEPKTVGFGSSTPTPASPAPPFTFGGAATTGGFGSVASASTPPGQSMDQNMDESPVRGATSGGLFGGAPKIAEPRPSHGSSGFSFGLPSTFGQPAPTSSPAPSMLFGGSTGGPVFGSSQPSATTPGGFGSQTNGTTGFGSQPAAPSTGFSFGGAATTSTNPFGEKKPEENKGGFGSGAFGSAAPTSSASTGFSFGQNKDAAPARPATAGSFSFTPTTQTQPQAPFGFGGPQNNSTGSANNAFSSAPNSPSTFNTASPSFAFGQLPQAAPAPVRASNGFSFGSSQPASPALGGGAVLGGGGFGSSAPNSAGSSGGGLFTIGAAPTAAPSAGGARQIKKLPTRKGVKR
ncbi:hypothetical protein CYLTODRAFT_454256 [Cylindrobasidium torrendii FP15055 ss-10]|uniref:Uncharacterized protein n=1 Tax=Cylindrobasidium torrendii FP15055 ss-10 TaxID=1314674 RepID=A0A0D7BDP5_9AGAR|nr:hypothetical protein CYLTODRAFT_454256 [Cylindrobasidium torrendii FP15055 ss-10]